MVRINSGTNTVRRNAIDLVVTGGGTMVPLAASGSMLLSTTDGSSLFTNTNIAEIIVLNGVSLSGTDLTNLETYLNTKWAIY